MNRITADVTAQIQAFVSPNSYLTIVPYYISDIYGRAAHTTIFIPHTEEEKLRGMKKNARLVSLLTSSASLIARSLSTMLIVVIMVWYRESSRWCIPATVSLIS